MVSKVEDIRRHQELNLAKQRELRERIDKLLPGSKKDSNNRAGKERYVDELVIEANEALPHEEQDRKNRKSLWSIFF